LNSWPHTCYAGTLPLEPLCQLFSHWLFWDRVSLNV
jgi:hypothetical protein